MKISLDWLSDYIVLEQTPEQIANTLSDLGLPCEGIERFEHDAVIDVEVTSNRPDCLSHIGIARELSVATGKPLSLPQVQIDEDDTPVEALAQVEILEPSLCGRYTGRVIRAVKVGPTPRWMKIRLETLGLRSVNNVVDATNYAMLETGQPPHAFDYNALAGHKVIVRKAFAGERLVSIDGSKCDLTPEMLIIADAEKAVGIAGVMGGLDSEVKDSTVDILLEDAHFEPVSIRTTSRKLVLPSEAAFRFERNVDMEAVEWASRRTAKLIMMVAGGKAAAGVIDVYPGKKNTEPVTVRLARVKKLLGIEIPVDKAVWILKALGFAPEVNDDKIVCSVPSWRRADVYREADLIEELARHWGYNKVPTNDQITIEVAPVDPRQRFISKVRTHLNACGFHETLNITFVDAQTAKLFGASENPLGVKEELRKDANLLRDTLIGSLAGVIRHNLNVKNSPCRVFEIAATFRPQPGMLPEEKTKAAIAVDGDLRDIRGVIESLVGTICRDADVVFEPVKLPWASGAVRIMIDGKHAGEAGIIDAAVLKAINIDAPSAAAAELDVEMLMSLEKQPRLKPISRFPAIDRDLSILVDESVRWADIRAAVDDAATRELQQVSFVDIYRGKGVGQGQKSLTLSLRFRDEDGTLTHEQVDQLQDRIVKQLEKSCSAVLRTA